MSTRTFYIYSPFTERTAGEYPVAPFLQVAVSVAQAEAGNVLLSPQLMSSKEIDEAIDRLKLDLESFREHAKLELRNLQSKMQMVRD